MIRAVVAVGRALGLRVVAEGVETAGQLETLRQLGTDEVQGYYLGFPENAETTMRRICGVGDLHHGAVQDLAALVSAINGDKTPVLSESRNGIRPRRIAAPKFKRPAGYL